jgi:hypothetical protein
VVVVVVARHFPFPRMIDLICMAGEDRDSTDRQMVVSEESVE